MIAMVQVEKWKRMRFREKLAFRFRRYARKRRNSKPMGILSAFYMYVIERSDGISWSRLLNKSSCW